VFTPYAAGLSQLELSGSLNSGGGGEIGTFTQSGGPAGDAYTFSMGGSGISNFSPNDLVANIEYLYTANTQPVPGGNPANVYALTVTIHDTTTGAQTGALPFDVVVGDSSGTTIRLETGTGNLGISSTTPTIVYGLKGDDTIDATGMTASVWMVGGPGADTMTGGSGQNTYLYGAANESPQGSGADNITNFHTTDSISFGGLNGITTVQGLLTSTSTDLAAHSIAWIQSGGNTLVYANTTSSSHSQSVTSNSVVEIILNTFTAANLAPTNFVLSNGNVGPAGVAGSPINLALTDPQASNGAPVTVTISGMPSDWQLNEGVNLGKGSWSVQESDVGHLAVLTSPAFAGAMALNVTETWTNSDGTTGTATVADNVEAYAPGNPIFALSGDDTLTGAGSNDTYVFAQPFGNDVIYNFNAATDKIDLAGLVNIASFGDLQGGMTQDGSGDAVIKLGAGESLTLHGVGTASLTASNFEFNQTPVVENPGTMTIGDNAVLPLGGTIDNIGVIALISTAHQSELQIVGPGITLEGAGQVTLTGDTLIAGTGSSTTLTNLDNTIAGAGEIGTGDGTLTLANETHGTINANVAGASLVLDTGATIGNAGVLEAVNGGTLLVADSVSNSGALEVNGGALHFEAGVVNSGSGHAAIAGGTLAFDAASNVDIIFDHGQTGTSYGELVLKDASQFTGEISGFTGTAGDQAHSDEIDLVNIDNSSPDFHQSYDKATGVLAVTDGTNSASLKFIDFSGTFRFSADGNGGTAIFDPPASNCGFVSIGGAGNDAFVFHPGMGAQVANGFDPHVDTIELDHFSDVQSTQQVATLITADAHGDAVIALGHNDSVTVPAVTASYLEAHLQSLVHLH
jgi:hypothetical protein